MFNLSHDDNEMIMSVATEAVQTNTQALNHGRELEILWDAFRSRIAKLGFPYDRTIAIDRRGSQMIAGDRTWFYLLQSSAIAIADDYRGVFPYDRRRS